MRQSELIFTGFVKSEAQALAPFCSACKPSGCRQPSQNSSFFFLVGRSSKLDWGSLLMSRFKYKLARVGKLLVSSQSGSVQPLENSGRCARGFEGQSTESGQMPRRCVCHQNPLCFDPPSLESSSSCSVSITFRFRTPDTDNDKNQQEPRCDVRDEWQDGERTAAADEPGVAYPTTQSTFGRPQLWMDLCPAWWKCFTKIHDHVLSISRMWGLSPYRDFDVQTVSCEDQSRGFRNRSFLHFWKIYFPFQPWKISKQSCIDADADMNSNLLTSSRLSCVVCTTKVFVWY